MPVSVCFSYSDGWKLKNRRGEGGTVMTPPPPKKMEHHCFSCIFKYLSISPSCWLPSYCTSSVYLHLENKPMFVCIFYNFLCLGKKRIKEWLIQNKTHTLVYLCWIPMQYGVKSRSRHWRDSACLDTTRGESVQSDVTVT